MLACIISAAIGIDILLLLTGCPSVTGAILDHFRI